MTSCDKCPLNGAACLGHTRPSVCGHVAREATLDDSRQRYWTNRVTGVTEGKVSHHVDSVAPEPVTPDHSAKPFTVPPLPPLPPGTVLVQGHANSYTGYGQHTAALAREIERAGFPVRWIAYDRDDNFIPLDPWVAERIVNL